MMSSNVTSRTAPAASSPKPTYPQDWHVYNEALLKVLCHNICVLIQSIHELGIEPVFGIGQPESKIIYLNQKSFR